MNNDVDKKLVRSARRIYDDSHKGSLHTLLWVEAHHDGTIAFGSHINPGGAGADKLDEALLALVDSLSTGVEE